MNHKNVRMGRLVWWLNVRSFLDRIDYNFGWICTDVACVAARCCGLCDGLCGGLRGGEKCEVF